MTRKELDDVMNAIGEQIGEQMGASMEKIVAPLTEKIIALEKRLAVTEGSISPTNTVPAGTSSAANTYEY